MWDVIVLIPNHCLSVYFVELTLDVIGSATTGGGR